MVCSTRLLQEIKSVALVVRVDKEKDYLDIIWKDEVGRFVPGSDFKIELTSSPEL